MEYKGHFRNVIRIFEPLTGVRGFYVLNRGLTGKCTSKTLKSCQKNYLAGNCPSNHLFLYFFSGFIDK